MINPYDLGEIVENTQGIKIDDLVRKAKQAFRLQFIKSSFDVNNIQIQLTTSKTRFGGERVWFVCPKCKQKRGVLYLASSVMVCRKCLGLSYKKQRYKEMIESSSAS